MLQRPEHDYNPDINWSPHSIQNHAVEVYK